MAPKTKPDIRKEFLTRRESLDAALRAKASSQIRQRLFNHPQWRQSSTVLCYVSFGSEVETHTLIQEALRFKKRVIVPVHDPAKKETPLSELHRFGELGPSHRGILQVQPEFLRRVSPDVVDLAVLPGIVFDREGGRIGFGGGYFDRLLPLMPRAYRMALAFDAQVLRLPLPLETHDVSMQTLLTETETLDIDPQPEKL